RVQVPEDPQGISRGITKAEVLASTDSWAPASAKRRVVKVKKPDGVSGAGRKPFRLELCAHAPRGSTKGRPAMNPRVRQGDEGLAPALTVVVPGLGQRGEQHHAQDQHQQTGWC